MTGAAVKPATSWWQTALATLGALLLFIPALLIVGLLPLLYRMVIAPRLGIEKTDLSHWITYFQYHASTALALLVPVFFLKRANVIFASIVYGGTLELVFLAIFAASALGYAGHIDGFGLIDILCSVAGVGFGAGSVAYYERRRR